MDQDHDQIERDAIAALKRLQDTPDIEKAHIDADAVLLAILKAHGYEKVVEEFLNVPKWYS